MRWTRLLPPLALLSVLGFVVWRAAQRPECERLEREIRVHWEDSVASARRSTVRLLERYVKACDTPACRAFAAHAYLRARDPAQAVRVRWPDLERPLPAEEVREFAREALLVLGWEDEAATEPSPANVQALLALLDADDPRARAWLEDRLARLPVEEVYTLMRRSHGLQEPRARAVVALACRRRGAAEAAAGHPSEDWDVNAALLALGRAPYAERERDVEVLVRVARGPWRVEKPPRWILSLRALGLSEHPLGKATLEELDERLTDSKVPSDVLDRGMLKAARLAGGDWEQEPSVRAMASQTDKGFGAVRASYELALLARWRAGEVRAAEGLNWLWSEVGTSDASVRERLARELLLGPTAPSRQVPVERLLADLEAPDTPAMLSVLALSYRLRNGEAGARDVLLRWLAGYASGGVVGSHDDPERSLAPPIAGLRALLVYP